MNHLDPDPLTVESEERWTPSRKVTREYVEFLRDIGASDELVASTARLLDRQERSTPSLTIPLVLLCAVVGALFVAWVVTR